MTVAAPARQIEIRDWEPCDKGTLRGFFTAELPSGLIIHRMMLHQKNDTTWIQPPSREWVDGKGVRQYARLIEWRDETVKKRFLDEVNHALARYLAEHPDQQATKPERPAERAVDRVVDEDVHSYRPAYSPPGGRRSGRKMAWASVTYDEEENDDGYLQDCVHAVCRDSNDEVGPIWGHSQASVMRALATLTEECSCGATFHKEEYATDA